MLTHRPAFVLLKTWEWHDAARELRKLHLPFHGFLNAGLPVFVETLDVFIEESQTVGDPFFQYGDFLFIGTDAIGSENSRWAESVLAQQFRILLKVTVLGLCQQFRLTVYEFIDMLGAECALAQLLIAEFDGLSELWVLKQSLP